jgi:hypothetical protein
MLSLSGRADHSFLQNLPDLQPEAFREDDPNAPGRNLDVMELVYRISYVGAVVLTADRVVRSMDSVLDRMQYRGNDGTALRLVMEPSRHGFDVMLKMSRPLEF